jgi:hypothetical protein
MENLSIDRVLHYVPPTAVALSVMTMLIAGCGKSE